MHQRAIQAAFFGCAFALSIAVVNGDESSPSAPAGRVPTVAGITTVYYHNSHADVILSRLLQTYTLDGKGKMPSIKLASVFTDQVPENDKSRQLAEKYGVPIFKSVGDAITLGTSQVAVDGVMLIAEHGKYPESPTGQIVFPKRRLFGEIVREFERRERVVPVFCDKHLADNWEDAKWIYDTATRLKIPMMAGSSLPGLWRYPPVDVRRGAKLKQIVGISYHRLDSYGFHALEMVQCLAERRAGGETGIARVRCLTGADVWEAEKRGVYDRRMLDAALSRLKEKPLPADKRIEELAKNPSLLVIDYKDGLRTCVFSLNYAVLEWASAWEYEDGEVESTLFWTQELRPFQHFAFLLTAIERMMHTGEPTWPVERTLMTSGVLDALLISKKQGGQWMKTPQLSIQYNSSWNWKQPLPPPPGRAITEQ